MSVTDVVVPAAPPKLTVVSDRLVPKFVPVIVIESPLFPLEADKEATVGVTLSSL